MQASAASVIMLSRMIQLICSVSSKLALYAGKLTAQTYMFMQLLSFISFRVMAMQSQAMQDLTIKIIRCLQEHPKFVYACLRISVLGTEHRVHG